MKKSESKKEDMETKKTQVLRGIVVSTKMKDTAVVDVVRFIKHPVLKKFYKVNKKYKAHDVGNTKKVGDKVEIRSSRPISKDKHFVVIR